VVPPHLSRINSTDHPWSLRSNRYLGRPPMLLLHDRLDLGYQPVRTRTTNPVTNHSVIVSAVSDPLCNPFSPWRRVTSRWIKRTFALLWNSCSDARLHLDTFGNLSRKDFGLETSSTSRLLLQATCWRIWSTQPPSSESTNRLSALSAVEAEHYYSTIC
jgi:hypothetical protein